MSLVASEHRIRHRIRVSGVVQGVGFRPFVVRLATELDLGGQVGNDTQGVLLEVEGRAGCVARFESRLVSEAPPMARIERVEATEILARQERGFRIVASKDAGPVRTFISPDVAVCQECLAEMRNPKDRRYRYPFINCTNCGPRFTITISLPYDRPNTTMAGFTLCDPCAREYHDPSDRRFHAQPVACAACGPRLWYHDGGTEKDDAGVGTDTSAVNEAILRAQLTLAEGGIVAVKGLGGYHLACDATSVAAVERLRRRKHRAHKPFAVMVADMAGARRLAFVDEAEAALLASPQRPIVLLKRRSASLLADPVAPDNPHVGLFLPYTPIHYLLFDAVPGTPGPVPQALVMTSGNLSDEPICFEDGDARSRLGRIADGWLVHDRLIHVPCDDSVVRVNEGGELPIRRSRGYAPLPVRLPFESPPLLAVGGELKNTFCLAQGQDAWMSQHIGDMGSIETLAAFELSTAQFGRIYGIKPHGVVADAHPGYHTRTWAERSGYPLTLVQHHHAHVAAVMVENGVAPTDRVIGYAFDGTGYGTDGAIWGGEALIAGYRDFSRAGHLAYVPLPGGDATVRKPYRAALAHLWAAGIEWSGDLAPVAGASTDELAVLRRQLERDVHCIPTSSMGRLFDAVSSLIGLRHSVSYEAQAAIELEALASAYRGEAPTYAFARRGDEFDPAPMLGAMVADLADGCPTGAVALGFHLAVARLVSDSASALRRLHGLDVVVLSGGVFQNVLLTGLVRANLGGLGFRVLTHRLVPPNDGGLALGQVAVAGANRINPTPGLLGPSHIESEAI